MKHCSSPFWPIGQQSLLATLLALGCCAPAWAAPDAVAEFKALVAVCKASYAAKPATEVGFDDPLQSWIKTARLPIEVRYDVKKTDSLIRPFSAFIEIIEVVAHVKAPGEEAARKLPVTAGDGRWYSSRFVYLLNFAYEDNRWVPVDVMRSRAARDKGARQFDKPFSTGASADGMRDPKAPFAACMPK